MLYSILSYILLPSLIAHIVNCQAPTWHSPTDGSTFVLDISLDKACTVNENVAGDDYLYALSSWHTVYYRKVSESPDDNAFTVEDDFASDKIIGCEKSNIKASQYQLIFGAYYNPRSDSNEATITVTINVQGLPEPKKPVWVKPNPDSTADDHVINLLESSKAGDVILTLSATDEDTEAEGLLFNMDKSVRGTRDVFIVEGNELKVKAGVTTDTFDIEKVGVVETYAIILEVSDWTSAETLLTSIILQDVNDNKPIFSGSFTAHIGENAEAGTTVITITVSDADKSAEFNVVSFKVDGVLDLVFILDGDKIVVATGATFSRATTPTYKFTIEASDSTNTETQEFTVNIKAAPVFVDPDPDSSKEKHKIYMRESHQKGDTIMTLLAIDQDSDDSALIYSIGDSSAIVQSLFEVDGNLLKVKSTVAEDFFDYEREGAVLSYAIVLKVTDELGLTSTLQTTIEIKDDNEFAPVFTSSTEAFGSITESSPGDVDECLSDPCENNGNCTGSSNGYTCSCHQGYGGERCQNDVDECLSQPCENNGACVNAINGFVCSCGQGYEGYRCQNEIGDQTTLIIVVLISSICVSSIVVLATVCCCLRYRREQKKTKLDASSVLNGGNMQSTKEVETVSKEMKEGHFNEIVYDEIKDTRAVETVSKEMKEEHFDEIVYEEIKDNTEADVADYESPVTGVEQPKDADGYLKFADNDQAVGYYKLKHTKTDDYTKLKHTKTDDYTTLSGCES